MSSSRTAAVDQPCPSRDGPPTTFLDIGVPHSITVGRAAVSSWCFMSHATFNCVHSSVLWFSFWICSVDLVRPGRAQRVDARSAVQAHLVLVWRVYFPHIALIMIHLSLNGQSPHMPQRQRRRRAYQCAVLRRVQSAFINNLLLSNSWPNVMGSDVWRKVRAESEWQCATIISIQQNALAEAQINRQSRISQGKC